jgi:hypothetical protein
VTDVVTSDPEGSKPKEPLTRVEREILEILEQSESEKPPVTDLVRWKAEQQRRERKLQLQSLRGQIAERMTPGMLLIFGVLLAVMAFMSRHVSSFLWRGFAIAALICLILPFILNWRRPNDIAAGPKRWRGQDIVPDSKPLLPAVDELKRWWKNRR